MKNHEIDHHERTDKRSKAFQLIYQNDVFADELNGCWGLIPNDTFDEIVRLMDMVEQLNETESCFQEVH